ncbi:MAG: pirin family protein, partial [Pseudomonadota bacterium]|nr:pirin family protein [Pseudomonadota bacterium]
MKPVLHVYQSGSTHWVGDGFPVRNLFPSNDLDQQLSPFLLLDHAGPTHFPPTNQPRGVGEHPHRGFETVTIVYQGVLEHRDSAGNHGTIGPGDVQWMTAASGVVHEEKHERELGAALLERRADGSGGLSKVVARHPGKVVARLLLGLVKRPVGL